VGRLAGFSGREVARVAEALGWRYKRTRGDHMVFEFPETSIRNLSIPAHRELSEGTLRGLIDIMEIPVDEFLRMARK